MKRLHDYKSFLENVPSFLNEGSIPIPEEITVKFSELYKLLKSNYDKVIDKLPDNSDDDCYIIYKKFFSMKDIKGNPFTVSIGLYNDKDDEALARMDSKIDVMKINMSSFDETELEEFENMCFHELIHSMDPLTKDQVRYYKYLTKSGVDLDNINVSPENFAKYKKLQFEYTAEMSRLVNKIKKIVGTDENRITYMFWIIKSVKESSDVEELYHATYAGLGNMIDMKMFSDVNEYWYFLNNLFRTIKLWIEDPKLKKKFWGDLYKTLNKKET